MPAFSWSPLRKLMKKSGADIVSREAVEVLIEWLEKYAKQITIHAMNSAKNSGRKKLTREDLEIAIKLMGGPPEYP